MVDPEIRSAIIAERPGKSTRAPPGWPRPPSVPTASPCRVWSAFSVGRPPRRIARRASKHPKRGRKRLFNETIYAFRMRVEPTFAWEDKFKRRLLRFERLQHRHYGMKVMAYTLINLRAFCGI